MLRERIKRLLLKQFRRLLAERVAIDLGTVNTLIYTEKHGIVLNEPSAIAVNKYTNEIVSVGREAVSMLGREPLDTVVHRPLRDGTIADYDMAEKMLQQFLQLSGIRRSKFLHIITAIPSLATGVERRALKAVARGTGAQWVSIIEEGLAAALGSGVLLEGSQARMVVDIGGGTTNITITSGAGIIQSTAMRLAGNEMNQAVTDMIMRKYRLQVGEQTAEQVKIQLGSAVEPTAREEMLIVGKSTPESAVKEIILNNLEVFQALEKSIQSIVGGVRALIEQAAPNVAVDIYQSGITLTGGSSLLRGFDRRLQTELCVPVQLAVRPLEAVVQGAGRLISNTGLLERYQLRDEVLEWDGGSSNYITVSY
jgi:rod shape-determining protein MreB and related proteins